MSNCDLKEITLDGVKYVRADSLASPALPGKRAVIVLDRGWIVAGDVTESDGRIRLTRAVHVRGWSSVGFDGLIASGGRGSSVTVKAMPNGFDAPADSEIFRVHVADDWGI